MMKMHNAMTMPNSADSCAKHHPCRDTEARFSSSHAFQSGGRQVARLVCTLLLAACWSGLVEGPVRAAENQRARGVGPAAEGRVYRDRVQAHWLPGEARFWYQVKTGLETHEFIFVDAEKGTRRPAFDHGRLARILADAGAKDVRAERLPLEKLEFSPGTNVITFRAGSKGWRCDLQSYALSEAAGVTSAAPLSGLPPDSAPRASTRTGAETSLVFANRTAGEVQVFWLDSDGQRQSYGRLAAGQEREQHTYAGHVWLVADATNKTLVVFEAKENSTRAEVNGTPAERPRQPAPESRRRRSSPSSDLSPDGHWRAMIKDHNLAVKDEKTGTEKTLSSDGNADDAYGGRFYWSPDSKRLVVMRTRKGEEHKVYFVESSPKDQVQPKLHSFDYQKPGDRLAISKPQLFEVAEGRHIPVSDELFSNPWSIEDVRWAPDSSRFTFLFNQRGHQVLRIVGVDAVTGQARPVVDERSQTFVCYSGKFFCEYLDDSDEIIWMSERDGWNHLYLYDAKAGRVKHQITRGEWVVRGVDRVDREKRQVWFRAGGIRPGQDPYYIHLCRVNFDGTGLVVLTDGDGTHALEYSPDRRFAIDTYSRVDLAPVNELRRTEDGKRVCELERADSSELVRSGWKAPERFVAKGRDGVTDIYGVIHRPRDLDPNKKYPVIEAIYAGPQDSFVPKPFRSSSRHEKFLELGFIVVQIDGMGTSNRSKKFHDVCWKNLADAGFPDRILWLKAAAGQYPYMDLTRVGVFGGSAGGQSALGALLWHGDFYKAAAADCGCHDNRMDKIWWNEQWMGWPMGPHYEEQSNVTQAHKLQGKLLLTVGEMDRNVDPASTMQVVNALIKANKDFELIIFPGANHGIGESPYGQRRRLEFFERHLLGGDRVIPAGHAATTK
jgi:dipeptidyl-peptidase 4